MHLAIYRNQKLPTDSAEEPKIQGLQDRVAAIKERKILQSDLRKLKAVKRKAAPPKTLTALQKVKTAIAEAVKNGEFDSVSEQATFEKVALDLLDKESEIRILAAMELGRMGNPAAVPVLREALNLHDDKLTTEIKISLKLIGVDAEVVAPADERPEVEEAATQVEAEDAPAEDEPEEAATQVEAEDAPAEDGEGGPPAELDEKGLMKMLKSDLLDLCEQRGIACEETMTKAQITELILSNQ